ncbi:MAG: DsbA family protein [Chloroflexi bacterium]|nr:DsbA family protein [Chloroflexota bacterium]
MFENQGNVPFNQANLKRFALELGVDAPTFNYCLDTDKHLELVRAETRANTEKGVTSTPTFFINGQKIVGAQPYEQFERVINIFLKK